ncbi:MAG: insulinase family protein [Oscillospiraceae bacterium]|nr:insulinase family protein [Oscillospiraceae bacterium]
MEYITKRIKEGINVHYIKTNQFKTNLIAIFLTKKLDKSIVTKNALIPAILVSGSKNMPSREDISKEMENLYGAELDCGVEKTGDNQILKFYIEALNNDYIITDENLLEECIEKILEVVFNPVLEDGIFKQEYINKEREKLKQLINSKIDSKDKYAQERCIEEMYKGLPYGLYKYGYVEELEDIMASELHEEYKNLINTAKIDIFISGDFSEKIDLFIKENENIQKLQPRTADFIVNNETTEKKEQQEIKIIEEKAEVSQGKLIIGLDVMNNVEGSRFAVSLYNVLLGGSPNSKLFQNVREAESLAYTVGSGYLRPKNNIIIRAGIEIDSYDKVIELIKKQIEDIKNGDITDEDIERAKRYVNFGIQSITEEQEVGITYYLGEELSGFCLSSEEYAQKINNVTKDDIIGVAQSIQVNTVYFLKN